MKKMHKVSLDFLTAFSFNYNDQKIKAYAFFTDNGFLFFPMRDNEILLDVKLDESIREILNEAVVYYSSKTSYSHNQIVYATREHLKELFKKNKNLKRQNYRIIPIDKIDMDNILNIIFDAIIMKKDSLSMDELIQNRINMFKKTMLIPFDELKEQVGEDIIYYCASLSAYLFFQVHDDTYKEKELYSEKIKELRKDIAKKEKFYIKNKYYYNITYKLRSNDEIYESRSFKTFSMLLTFYKKIYKLLDKYYLVLLNGTEHIEIERTTMNALEKNKYLSNYPMIWN